MTLLPGPFTVFHLIALVGYVLCLRLTCSSTTELEQTLATAVVDALAAAHLSVKEAAALMQIDEGQLRHQLKCERQHHISLTRLIRLPYAFWLHFAPVLMFLVAKKRMHEIADDLGLRKGA